MGRDTTRTCTKWQATSYAMRRVLSVVAEILWLATVMGMAIALAVGTMRLVEKVVTYITSLPIPWSQLFSL